MRHNAVKEYLGVDVGRIRIGIARGSGSARLAEALKTVPAEDALTEINTLASQKPISGIAVGLPRNLQGEETAQTKAVREWVRNAKEQIDVPFYWQDEALTSVSADGDDAKAAAIILQDFLDTPASQRVRC